MSDDELREWSEQVVNWFADEVRRDTQAGEDRGEESMTPGSVALPAPTEAGSPEASFSDLVDILEADFDEALADQRYGSLRLGLVYNLWEPQELDSAHGLRLNVSTQFRPGQQLSAEQESDLRRIGFGEPGDQISRLGGSWSAVEPRLPGSRRSCWPLPCKRSTASVPPGR